MSMLTNYGVRFLLVFMSVTNLNHLFANFRPLNFDLILPASHFDNLLKISTQLFYDINYLDLEPQVQLNQVTSHLINLIGAVFIYNDQVPPHSVRCEDLFYLQELIADANLAFYNVHRQSDLSQSQFIINLFLQIKKLLTATVDNFCFDFTRSNLRRSCR